MQEVLTQIRFIKCYVIHERPPPITNGCRKNILCDGKTILEQRKTVFSSKS